MTAGERGQRIRIRVHYSGRVQGVGFRATARAFARGHLVAGWVRNEPDGSVSLEAEGPKAELEAFLGEIDRHFAGYITHERRVEVEPMGAEGGFSIDY